jgi:hypothetical protein
MVQLHAHLLAAIAAERRRGYQGLAGSDVRVTIPFRQAAIDTIFNVTRWPPPIEALELRVGPGNLLTLRARVRGLGLVVPVRARMRLIPTANDGVLELTIEDDSTVTRLLVRLGAALARLPRGVRLQGSSIRIDTRPLAASYGFADLASMISPESWQTDEGALWLTLRVRPPATAHADDAPSTTEAVPSLPGDPRQWLEGTSVKGEVRIDEVLANALLRAASHDAPAAADPISLRFESGAVVVSVATVFNTAGSSDQARSARATEDSGPT